LRCLLVKGLAKLRVSAVVAHRRGTDEVLGGRFTLLMSTLERLRERLGALNTTLEDALLGACAPALRHALSCEVDHRVHIAQLRHLAWRRPRALTLTLRRAPYELNHLIACGT
jgi:hypothetical protein